MINYPEIEGKMSKRRAVGAPRLIYFLRKQPDEFGMLLPCYRIISS